MKRPFEIYILFLFLVLLSANAFYGGLSMIFSPDGSLLGMEPGWLKNTPFNDFMIPGILLTIFMGIFPLVALAGLIWENCCPWLNVLNIYRDKTWGWTFSLYCGIMCITWIIVQQLIAEYFILQPIISSVGLTIIILSLLPGIQKSYTK